MAIKFENVSPSERQNLRTTLWTIVLGLRTIVSIKKTKPLTSSQCVHQQSEDFAYY